MVELLTVLAIISLITAVAAPSFTSVSSGYNLTNSTNTLAGALQRARTYAMAHNTYVWVGLYEENADAAAPTVVPPPYTGQGRIVLGMAASLDGTQIYADSASAATLPAARIAPIDKLIRLQNVHLSQIVAPSSTTEGSTLLTTRPVSNYSIYSSSAQTTPYPMVIGQYTFYNTIRFSPSGEVSINGSTTPQHIGEIGLQPTHGDTLEQTPPNLAAIQFTGIGGNVQVYRN